MSTSKEATWQIKDRVYLLKSNKQPVIVTVPSKHSQNRPLLYFDAEKGYQRELRYATNQKSPFADEQQGTSTLEHIVFRDGQLFVPKEKQSLQKLLSLYHPLRNKLYVEFDKVAEAKDDLDYLEAELSAMTLAAQMDIDDAEAVLRVEYGSKVSQMSSKEIKRDVLLFAKSSPVVFLELAADDNVKLRNFGIKAVEAGYLKLADDQRTFKYGSNGRKVMTVPFDENPYSALAAYFKTDEGLEIYKAIEKKMG